MTSDVGRAMEGLYTMGVMFLSVGLTLLVSGHDHAQTSQTYMTYFLILLGIVLISLAGVLVSKTSGTPRNWAIVILVIGILFVVGAGALLAAKPTGKMSLSYCSL